MPSCRRVRVSYVTCERDPRCPCAQRPLRAAPHPLAFLSILPLGAKKETRETRRGKSRRLRGSVHTHTRRRPLRRRVCAMCKVLDLEARYHKVEAPAAATHELLHFLLGMGLGWISVQPTRTRAAHTCTSQLCPAAPAPPGTASSPLVGTGASLILQPLLSPSPSSLSPGSGPLGRGGAAAARAARGAADNCAHRRGWHRRQLHRCSCLFGPAGKRSTALPLCCGHLSCHRCTHGPPPRHRNSPPSHQRRRGSLRHRRCRSAADDSPPPTGPCASVLRGDRD